MQELQPSMQSFLPNKITVKVHVKSKQISIRTKLLLLPPSWLMSEHGSNWQRSDFIAIWKPKLHVIATLKTEIITWQPMRPQKKIRLSGLDQTILGLLMISLSLCSGQNENVIHVENCLQIYVSDCTASLVWMVVFKHEHEFRQYFLFGMKHRKKGRGWTILDDTKKKKNTNTRNE